MKGIMGSKKPVNLEDVRKIIGGYFERKKPFPISYQDLDILQKKLIKDGYRDCTIGDFGRIMREELKKYEKSYSS
jgi:hypothetical protein